MSAGGSEAAPEAGGPAAALEEALAALGPFGLYQRYSLLLLCVPHFFAAMYSLNYIFVVDAVPFRCVVPECEGAGEVAWEAGAAAGPLTASACERFAPLRPPDLANLTCERDDYHPSDTVPCERLVYEHRETVYAEFGLGCREWLRTLVGTVRNSALPLALLLTGFVSDSFGRRAALCAFAACAGALGVVKGFSVGYEMFLAMEFLEAALGYGFASAAYVLMVELARPSQRAAFACATGVAYGAGGVALAGIARRARYWRHLLWVTHAPALLLPLYRLLVDESARWLHARGRRAEAAAAIARAARWNKVALDEALLARLTAAEESAARPQPTGGEWRGALRSRALRGRLALCGWCWASAAFVYYGLTINSVSLAGDKYVNFALNMATEIVASLLVMMALERFGRKWSIFGAFVSCGVACAASFLAGGAGARLGLFLAGKLSITFAFNSLYVHTAELFPTRVRSSALAACSLLGRVGSVLAPQTPLLSGGAQAALYGACSALAALAVLFVPETRRAPLPPDVAAAETLRAAPSPDLPPLDPEGLKPT